VFAADGSVMSTCKQEITLVDMTPFMASEIEWPQNLLLHDTDMCAVSDLLPNNLDALYSVPRFPTQDEHCALLGYDYDDVVTGEGGCMKITRHWTVIDWCAQVDGEFVTYEIPVDQVIEIKSKTVPVIELTEDPITFVSNSINCVDGHISIPASAPNVCQDGLTWTYEIRDLAGTVMFSGTSDLIENDIVAGLYTVEWTATSGCDITGTRMQSLIVENTKAPVPVCMNGMDLPLVSQNAVLTPDMIDVGSYSTCNNPLSFSFDAAGTVMSLSYNCSQLGDHDIPLWVTDMVSGNQDFCLARITVTDPDEDCATLGLNYVITGEVYTEDFLSIEDVQVSLSQEMPMAMTDVEGNYAFDAMPEGGDYKLEPAKNDGYLNGVSTLDLILIQRHILGLETLVSPYNLIAADIDQSKSINGVDLVELRKLILGIYSELPNNTSWKFLDASHEFIEELDPWHKPLSEDYIINNLESDMEIDFIGIKIGDVNGSVVTSSLEEVVIGRSQRWPLYFDVQSTTLQKGEEGTIIITAENYERVTGWQGTLEVPADNFVIKGIRSDKIDINESNFNLQKLSEGLITFSYSGVEELEISNGETLFEIDIVAVNEFDSESDFRSSSRVINSEAYRGYSEIVPLEIRAKKSQQTQIYGVQPNPWVSTSTIEFYMTESGYANWEFFDSKGMSVYRKETWFPKGENKLVLTSDEIEINGMIYIKLNTELGNSEFKMIKM